MSRFLVLPRIAAVVGLMGLTTALLSTPARSESPAPVPTEKPSAARGETLYLQNCTQCHGDTGKGDGPTITDQGQRATDFTRVTYIRDKCPATLFDAISNGRMEKLMPPWKNQFSNTQMWDLVFYTWALATPAGQLAAGQEIYATNCVACHGARGLGEGPNATGLMAGHRSFADLSYMMAKGQSDLFQVAEKSSGHEKWLALNADAKWATLAFIRTFSYEPLSPETFNGTITGKVIAGTEGGETNGLAGLEVTLYSFRGNQSGRPVTTTTDLKGEFLFNNVGTSPSRQHDVSVRFRNVEYFIEQPLSFSSGDTSLAVTVPVYETTTDSSGIRLERNHLIIEFQDRQSMRINELYLFSNDMDRTFIGDRPVAGSDRAATLRFILPSGATDPRFEDARMDITAVRSGSIITDTLPVPPVGRQVLLSYALPYTSPDFKLVKPIVYDTAVFNVLVMDLGERVKISGLQERDRFSPASGASYLNLVGQNIPAGRPLVVELSNIPANLSPMTDRSLSNGSTQALTPGLNQELIRWMGLGLAVLAALAAVGYPMIRGRDHIEAQSESQLIWVEPSTDSLDIQHQDLLENIARLDDAFHAGELEEADFHAQRSATKAKLMQVMREQRRVE